MNRNPNNDLVLYEEYLAGQIGRWLIMMRTQSIFVLLIAMASIALMATSCSYPVPDAKAKYQQACAPVIQSLQAEFVKNGKYPAYLTWKQQRTLDRLGPPTRYSVYNGGTNFTISIGNYSLIRCPFVYSYSSMHTNWSLDN